MSPRPRQVGQSAKCCDSIEPRMRWRVISRRPNSEIGATEDLARSRLRRSRKRFSMSRRWEM